MTNIPNHSDSIRAPQLVVGVRYTAKVWAKTPVYVGMTFRGWSSAGVMMAGRQPMLNRMTSLDALHFEGDAGEQITAVSKDLALAELASGHRLTFFKAEGGVVVPENNVTPAQPVVELVPEVVEEVAEVVVDKAAIKREKDRLRKAAARAKKKAEVA